MNYTVLTYSIYLPATILLTIWVARTLFTNGRIFLFEIFHQDNILADSVNKLLLVGFYLSYDISSRFWIWDREWHTPFTSALRVQRMPFRNVYEPALTLRYHMAGDLFAALLQSLSFARMNASRALSFAHDMQSALLVGSIAMIFRARTPWSPLVAARPAPPRSRSPAP